MTPPPRAQIVRGRIARSAPPPGGKGTMTVTGRVGKLSCAIAGAGADADNAAASAATSGGSEIRDSERTEWGLRIWIIVGTPDLAADGAQL